MHKNLQNLPIYVLGWILLIGLPACSPITSPGNDHRATPRPVNAVTMSLPSTTADVLLLTPTPSPSPSFTPTPSPSATASMTPTWTPAPTLDKPQARALVQDLLENNGGCRLPCWWGMTPGVTDWNTARHFLDTFAVQIGQGGKSQTMKNGISIYETNFTIRYEREDGKRSGFGVVIVDGTITNIITGDKTHDYYSIKRLLTDYGLPDEVLISAIRDNPIDVQPPFHIILYYVHKGFWVNYEWYGKQIGEKIKGCYQSNIPTLYLNLPDEKWTEAEMSRALYGSPYPGGTEYPVLSLKEATGMDLEAFYQMFIEPDEQSCLETPVEIWPP